MASLSSGTGMLAIREDLLRFNRLEVGFWGSLFDRFFNWRRWLPFGLVRVALSSGFRIRGRFGRLGWFSRIGLDERTAVGDGGRLLRVFREIDAAKAHERHRHQSHRHEGDAQPL